MSDERLYRVGGPHVLFEEIDGELIVVNMERGSYYSTDSVGADIWALLLAGSSVKQMIAALRERYLGDNEAIATGVRSFLEQLSFEGLVSGEAAESPPTRPNLPASEARPFRAPELSVHRDMRDMLLLDPVHDVEAAGWPVPKVESAQATDLSA